MHLFDVSERVEEGWPVSVDIRKRRMFLDLGWDKKKEDVRLYLRFGASLNNLFFEDGPVDPTIFEDLYLAQGKLKVDAWGVCLTRQRYPDDEALVRTRIAAGPGGRVRYAFHDVQVVVEGVEDEEGLVPMYLLHMGKNSSFEVTRDGELEGAPEKLVFTWTGEQLLMA